MIYFSSAIVLAPSATEELWRPLILWENLVTVGGITADEEDADYPATNIANPDTSSLWKGETTGDQDIEFSLTLTEAIDSVGIARHNGGSTGTTFKLYGLTDEPGAVEVLLAEFSPGDDSPILAVFDEDFYTTIRLRIEPGTAVPQAAVVYIGKTLRLDRGIPPGHIPLFDAREIDMLVGRAENGDFLGDIITQERLSAPLDLRDIDPDWYREYLRPFVRARTPFFFAWSPLTYPDECGFAKITNNPKPTIAHTTGEIDISMQLAGLAL